MLRPSGVTQIPGDLSLSGAPLATIWSQPPLAATHGEIVAEPEGGKEATVFVVGVQFAADSSAGSQVEGRVAAEEDLGEGHDEHAGLVIDVALMRGFVPR